MLISKTHLSEIFGVCEIQLQRKGVLCLECDIFYGIRKTKAKVVENSALCFSQLPLTVRKIFVRTVSSRGLWLQMDGIIMVVFSLKAKRTGSLSVTTLKPCFP